MKSITIHHNFGEKHHDSPSVFVGITGAVGVLLGILSLSVGSSLDGLRDTVSVTESTVPEFDAVGVIVGLGLIASLVQSIIVFV